jgi:hypothetical protein
MSEETTPPEDAPQVADAGRDVPPDRLAISHLSPFFDADKLQRGIGIRFKDIVRNNVDEYCISEGWVRVQAGKSVDRRGQPLLIKLTGPVEAWFEDLGEGAPVAKKD